MLDILLAFWTFSLTKEGMYFKIIYGIPIDKNVSEIELNIQYFAQNYDFSACQHSV